MGRLRPRQEQRKGEGTVKKDGKVGGNHHKGSQGSIQRPFSHSVKRESVRCQHGRERAGGTRWKLGREKQEQGDKAETGKAAREKGRTPRTTRAWIRQAPA